MLIYLNVRSSNRFQIDKVGYVSSRFAKRELQIMGKSKIPRGLKSEILGFIRPYIFDVIVYAPMHHEASRIAPGASKNDFEGI